MYKSKKIVLNHITKLINTKIYSPKEGSKSGSLTKDLNSQA